jgi:hypothetical protein
MKFYKIEKSYDYVYFMEFKFMYANPRSAITAKKENMI